MLGINKEELQQQSLNHFQSRVEQQRLVPSCHHRYRCMKCREKHCTLVALKVSIKGNKKNQGMEALMSESMGRGNNSKFFFPYLLRKSWNESKVANILNIFTSFIIHHFKHLPFYDALSYLQHS